ncbi:hypothetical protein OUQ12_002837 [Salmonella enterica]|nr:hypothetical protein [Salmonella enterica]EKE3791420.1 hypothetical protein [Salmonella enterica]
MFLLMPVRPEYIRYPWRTSQAAVPYPRTTSVPGVLTSVTGPVSSACVGCSLLMVPGPHGLALTAMHSPARHST